MLDLAAVPSHASAPLTRIVTCSNAFQDGSLRVLSRHVPATLLGTCPVNRMLGLWALPAAAGVESQPRAWPVLLCDTDRCYRAGQLAAPDPDAGLALRMSQIQPVAALAGEATILLLDTVAPADARVLVVTNRQCMVLSPYPDLSVHCAWPPPPSPTPTPPTTAILGAARCGAVVVLAMDSGQLVHLKLVVPAVPGPVRLVQKNSLAGRVRS